LNEPQNEKIQDLYFRLVEFQPTFLEHSESKFKERFDRIIKE
jgi:hypothetical protein